MAEYIEREALVKKINREKRLLNSAFPKRKLCVGDVFDCIFTAPTADVVEVVRCKDCKHRYVPTRCALWYATVDDKEYFVERGDDFYCSYGEAKMDGKGENDG